MNASWKKYTLNFETPGGTSRGVMTTKDSYFITIEFDGMKGIGECGLLRGLSIDDRPDYEQKLDWVCKNIELDLVELYGKLKDWPSIQFGLEQAFKMIEKGGSFTLFKSPFTQGKGGIPINGLVWMGDIPTMAKRLEQKLDEGFRCIKLKIGALNWDEEFELLKSLRKRFDAMDLEIRVDANGAFDFYTAEKVLDQLADLEIHSIEQPIKAGQWEEMAALVEDSLVPIALDEELIGITDKKQKIKLLKEIQPDYLILKPSLLGGWRGCDEWITLAEHEGIDWWATSALESNIGLNAIAQWVVTKRFRLPQGLGTGGVFTNNISSPLVVQEAGLWLKQDVDWDLSALEKA
jgi:o-succinylbenzoate synthase